jgi:hypothetical protein
LPEYFTNKTEEYPIKLENSLEKIREIFLKNKIEINDRLDSFFEKPLASNNLTINSCNNLLLSDLALLEGYKQY